MKLHTIIAENWHADGGACFGVVPKAIWSKNYPADENNLLKLTNRCLLIEDENRLILIDTGMGNKQNEKFFQYQYLHGDDSLVKSFAQAGFKFDDVTDVIFTHLHFDHVGGAVKYNETGKLELVFKNATHYCSKAQWEWAMNPNPREGASYFKENLEPIIESGSLKLIEQEGEIFPNIFLKIVNGHTEGQIIPIIDVNGKKIVFTADFIPSAGNIPIAYIPSYDTRPLISMEEKEKFLEESVSKNYILLFEHDFYTEACTVEKTPRGIKAKETFALRDIL